MYKKYLVRWNFKTIENEKTAEVSLYHDSPHFSAKAGQSIFQKIFISLVFFLFMTISYYNIEIIIRYFCFFMIMTFCTLILLKTLFLIYGVVRNSSTHESMDFSKEWPVYTIFIPLYREEKMIPLLIQRLNILDYPKDKLDIHFIIEADDLSTFSVFKEYQDLPFPATIQVIPVGNIRTKPKAMAVCLDDIAGEFMVIFDAEDRPEPLQLKKSSI